MLKLGCRVVALAALALCLGGAACVRGGFGATRSSHGGGDAASDIPVAVVDSALQLPDLMMSDGPIDPANIRKPGLSMVRPLLAAASPDGNSCGRYLVSLPANWMPSTFVHQGQIHFAVPCKYDDSGSGGWHLAFARWDRSSDEVVWLDGDPAKAGVQELVSKSDEFAPGQILGNLQTTTFVDTPQGLMGVGRRHVANVGYRSFAVEAASVAQISAQSWLAGTAGFSHVEANDSTFKGRTEPWKSLLYGVNTLYIYNESVNAPANSKRYIWVSRSLDLKTVDLPAKPLAEGYRFPLVARDGKTDAYYLLAYSLLAEQWQLIPGSSPESFDFGRAQSLYLERFRGGVGAWDFAQYVKHGAGQPWVIGMEIVDRTLYLFYLAGEMGFVGSPPYNAPRGVGVLELKL